MPNPKGIESFSPVLADEIGLRRVIGKRETTLKGLGQSHRLRSPNSRPPGDSTLSGLMMVWALNPA
jgi:hypothetical protein